MEKRSILLDTEAAEGSTGGSSAPKELELSEESPEDDTVRFSVTPLIWYQTEHPIERLFLSCDFYNY
jgi:hypothetical protein